MKSVTSQNKNDRAKLDMILLAIVYLAFISLGLPDSLVGSAWPVMHGELGVPVSYAGIITMIIAGGTIVSSLLSERVIRKLGTGVVTAISVLLTAIALFGFSVSDSFISLCLWAIPYGLGAGAVDAALNNYVALHFVSRHMNWLHCFWGVGASISPYIMSYCLTGGYGWGNGYRAVSFLQLGLTVILFISLPLWRKGKTEVVHDEAPTKALGVTKALKIKGVPLVLLTFFGYCALEHTAGLWASSYFVQQRGVAVEIAAQFASLFFVGITVGRFLSGFIAEKLGDKRMVRIGLFVAIMGILMIMLPVKTDTMALIGLSIIGFGCAPIYPCLIHATPSSFGNENSQAIIGIQMASAYVATTFIPPLFGIIAEKISIGLYPLYLLVFGILIVVMSEWLNKILQAKHNASSQNA